MSIDEAIKKAAELLVRAKRAVVFSGAGMSAESGIPTFRDPGGLWDRFDPSLVGTAEGIMSLFAQGGGTIRQMAGELLQTFGKVQPNEGHHALAELEKMGIVKSVVTQNIDNLHREAGNTRVFEVHGNLYRNRCVNCGSRFFPSRQEIFGQLKEIADGSGPLSLDDVLARVPRCECGGLSRPDVVMFGEAVQELPESFVEARSCDVMLVLGTSGVVYPAALVPREAKTAGAKLIEVNPTENAYASMTDVFIQERSAAALPMVIEEVKRIQGAKK